MRTVLTALVALFCLGCQQTPKLQVPPTAEMLAGAAANRCASGANRADCTIDVQIIERGSECTVLVPNDQDEVAFDRRSGRRLILWQIGPDARGYKFTDNGIAFKGGLDPLGNFSGGGTGPLGQIYYWRSRNGAFDVGSYPYGISVENPARNIRCAWDPRIRNQ